MTDNSFNLDIRAGETVDEALLRISAELTEANPPKEKQPAKKVGKRSKPPQAITVSDPAYDPDNSSGSPSSVDGTVFSAVHIYRRSGTSAEGEAIQEPEGIVRSNATKERKMHGPGTLVFCHQHSFGEACTPACRERVLDEV